MTRAEFWGALRYTHWWADWGLPGISFWRRIELVFLKYVAIAGYYHGKGVTLQEGSSRQEALRSKPSGDYMPESSTSDPDVRSAEESSSNGKTSPFVAVVVPFLTRDAQDLAQLIAVVWKLHNQSRKADLILLVDDGSPLSLPPCLGNHQLKILRTGRNLGPATARNIGLRLARHSGAEIVCFTDVDCEPASDWLAAMEAAQLDQPGIICGRTLSTAPGTAFGLFHDLHGTLNGRTTPSGAVLYGCTCNLSISTTAVSQAFDESFRAAAFEDVEFCVRAKKQGVQIHHADGAVVNHQYAIGVRALYGQFARYGMAEPQMTAKHPEYLDMLRDSEDISSLPGARNAACQASA